MRVSRFQNQNIGVERVNHQVDTQPTLLPFHLSICCHDLELTRFFYVTVLGIEERRASETSAHFDFYGSQITFHEVPGYNAKNIQREVDAEDLPVPHFGAALPFTEWERVSERLIAHNIQFVSKPHLRFMGKQHEQFVMFIEDPSGHGIEIKSFTNVAAGAWT
jgi:uncharacterized protein